MTVKVAESVLSIGTTVDADDATEFGADTYVAIGGLHELSEVGGERGIGNVTTINDGGTTVYETSLVPSVIECTFVYDEDDLGQAALEAAHAAGGGYNFKFVMSNGAILYFKAFVSKAAMTFGTTDDVAKLTVSLAQTKGFPVKVAA